MISLPLPVLGRHLALEAMHGRTFWLRPLVGTAIALAAAAFCWNDLTLLFSGSSSALGAGGAIFDGLVGACFLLIYLAVPALVAPAIAAEEERGTLDLLTIAGVGPLAMLVQLGGARLLSVASLALVAVPLAAIAYAMGGVSDARAIAAICVLLLTALQIAVCALAAGARRSSEGRAVSGAYVMMGLHLLVLLPLISILVSLATYLVAGFTLDPIPWLWYRNLGRSPGIGTVLAGLVPCLISILIHFHIARKRMHRRATDLPPAQHWLMERWRPAARWERGRRRIIVKFGLDRQFLPRNDPIGWRVLLGTPLVGTRPGKARNPLLVMAGALAATILLFNVLLSYHNRQVPPGALWFLAYATLAIALCLGAWNVATAIALERGRGSIDILALTPLSGPEIVHGHFAGARRLMRWAIPIAAGCQLVAVLIQASLSALAEEALATMIAVCTIGTVLWGSYWIGSRCRNAVSAGASVAVIALVMLGLPRLLAAIITSAGYPQFAPWFEVLDPLVAIWAAHKDGNQLLVLTSAIVLLAAWRLLRRHCLRHLDAWIGRQP